MKKKSDKKLPHAADLIVDLQNTWSKFECSPSKKSSEEKIENTIIKPKKIKRIIPKDLPIAPSPELHQSAQIKIDKKMLSPNYFLGQGLNFYNNGNYKKAISCFQIVLNIDPNNEESKNYLTRARAKLVRSSKEECKDKVIEDYLAGLKSLESMIQEKMEDNLLPKEISSLQKNDQELVKLNTSYLIENDKENKLEIEGLINEVMKRRDAEEKVRLFSLALEQSTEGIAVTNLEGNLLFANNAFANMHGFESKNVIGKHITSFQSAEQTQRIEDLKSQNYNSSEFRGEDWHRRNDGSVFPTYTHTSFFRDELGNPIGMIGTHRDITKLKKSEEEIRKLSSAVEQSIDGIAISDLNSKLTYVNEAFAEMHGYSQNDMIGMKVEKLHNNNQTEIFNKGMNKVKTKGSWEGEVVRIRKDGSPFPSYLSITLLKNNYEKITGFLAITRDITKRKQLEEEIKMYTEHLEDEVKKRTYDLIQSEKMASLGQVVAGVAHEINNPLGYVNSNTEIISEYLDSLKNICKEKKALKIIQNMKKLINTNLIGMFRIAKTTKSLERFAIPYRGEKIIVDINQGIKDTLFILSNQFKHRIKVHEDFGKIPKMICSPGQLNQVFTNIILNASEAMDKGNLWIKTSSENGNIFIKISDDGKGIPKDLIHRIFDPFFSTKKSCTGLGLSLSYRIIQAHNGDIKVNSEEGKGTTITIRLPMVG